MVQRNQGAGRMTSDNAFLEAAGWTDADQTPLAGDASSRRYIRLYQKRKRAILMVDPQDDTNRFASMARHLNAIGLSAPGILTHDGGLMILEDFGDDQFATVIQSDPDQEVMLYRAAVDVLCWLEAADIPTGLNTPTPRDWADIIEPVFTDYLPVFGVQAGEVQQELIERLGYAFDTPLPTQQVIPFPHTHPAYVMCLSERYSVQQVRIIDFKGPLIAQHNHRLS